MESGGQPTRVPRHPPRACLIRSLRGSWAAPVPDITGERALTTTDIPVRPIPPGRPLRWLALGWRDFTRAFWPSLLHGLVVALGGLAILWITLHHWYLLPGAVTGFVLVGPILATGLYALSRGMEGGEPPRLRQAWSAWCCAARPLLWLGIMLALAGTAWVLVSAALFALFVDDRLDTPLAFLRYVVAQDDLVFLLWVVLGGLGAALVFAATVVSAPLLLDREVDFRSALLTSVRAVGESPVAMALWAALIMLATAVSMATLMLGFVLVVPVFGHATWHAYRDAVDAQALKPRP